MLQQLLTSFINLLKAKEFKIGVDNALFYNLIERGAEKIREQGFKVSVITLEEKQDEIDNTNYDIIVITKNPNFVKLNTLVIITTISDLWQTTEKPVITVSPQQLGVSINKVLYALSIGFTRQQS